MSIESNKRRRRRRRLARGVFTLNDLRVAADPGLVQREVSRMVIVECRRADERVIAELLATRR
jgi:hypothetical protein